MNLRDGFLSEFSLSFNNRLIIMRQLRSTSSKLKAQKSPEIIEENFHLKEELVRVRKNLTSTQS